MTSLLLGAFEMIATDGSSRVMAEGTSWGEPVPIVVAINTFLQDGAIEVTQGHGNRTVPIRLRFYGDDIAALNAKEAALFVELERPNTLTWTPPDGAPATVFVVVNSSLGQEVERFEGEVQDRPWRTYTVNLTCESFTQSATETVTAALAATGTTTTLVNNGSATTGWTGAVNGGATAPAVVSGAVKVTSTSLSGTVVVSNTLTAAITTSSTKYIAVDWKPESNFGAPGIRAFGDAIELNRVAQAASPTAGYTRTWFGPVAASSIAVLQLDSTSVDNSGLSAVRSLAVDNVDRTDVKPALGSARQLLRSIEVVGSARTQGAIAIEHASSSLGDVLAYFFPDAPNTVSYSPPLRQYRNAAISTSTVTTDTARVSGAREVITGFTVSWDVPLANLIPGSHLFMPRVVASSTASVLFNWSVATTIGGLPVTTTAGTFTTTFAAGVYTNICMARMILPNGDASSAAASSVVRISLTATSAATVTVDEAWVFNTGIGQLVQANCGSGTAAPGSHSPRLFIEPATVATPRPTVRVGYAADRSDAYYPNNNIVSLPAWQYPQFNPSRVNVLTVTSNALDASVTLRHFARWHTNPAA